MRDIKGYSLTTINKIINEIGGRAPGSKEEQKAALMISDELRKYTDNVTIENFIFHPGAFLGFIQIVYILLVCSELLFHYIPLLSFIMVLVSIIIVYEEFFCYNEFIDFLYPVKTSQNVIGKFEPSEKNKNIIIVSGHHDSAHEFRLLAISPYLYLVEIGLGFLTIALLFIMNLFWLIDFATSGLIQAMIPDVYLIAVDALWYVILLLLVLTSPLLFFKSKRAVPGAVDNLSAVAILLSVAKTLSEEIKNETFKLRNTTVFFVSFGAEEAGLRGSKRFVAKHLNELKEAKTYVLNIDTVADPSKLSVVVKEKTTNTKHSMELARKIMTLSNTLGIKISPISLPSIGGGTDAVPFSRAGIDAITFFAVDLSLKTFRFYHTMRDTPDKINPDVLQNIHDIIIEFIKRVDTER